MNLIVSRLLLLDGISQFIEEGKKKLNGSCMEIFIGTIHTTNSYSNILLHESFHSFAQIRATQMNGKKIEYQFRIYAILGTEGQFITYSIYSIQDAGKKNA